MATFSVFTMSDLAVCFRVLRDEGGRAWRETGTGLQMGSTIDAVAAALEAVGEAKVVAAPAAPAGRSMPAAMRDQDAAIKSLRALLGLVTDDPTATPEMREAVRRVTEALDPAGLARLRRATDRVAAAPALDAARAAVRDDLALLRAPGGRSAADLLGAWLAGAEELYALIRRAPAAGPSSAGLRSRAARVLTEMRRRLDDEARSRAELPDDLASRVFEAIDRLADDRGQAVAARRHKVARAAAPALGHDRPAAEMPAVAQRAG